MNRLTEAINKAHAFGQTVEEWDAVVGERFAPYVSRKSILSRDRESFRSELLNLNDVEAVPKYADLLRRIVRKYRRNIRADQAAALRFMANGFEGTCRADEHWMSLFMTHNPVLQSSSLYDQVFQRFGLLESILEGSYKLYLRIIYGFAARDCSGQFPSDVGQRDLGNLLSPIPQAYTSRAHLLIEDPEHGIQVSQWRNIAAHKSFTVTSENEVEVTFGRSTLTSKRIDFAALGRVLDWAKHCLATVRLANVIAYSEYMPELKRIGLPDVPLRLESSLVTIYHNLSIVGFECKGYSEEFDAFVLSVRDRLGRAIRESAIHASQVLDQISAALADDATTRHRFKLSVIRLLDEYGTAVASASIKIEDAVASFQGNLSLKERVERTTFEFS